MRGWGEPRPVEDTDPRRDRIAGAGIVEDDGRDRAARVHRRVTCGLHAVWVAWQVEVHRRRGVTGPSVGETEAVDDAVCGRCRAAAGIAASESRDISELHDRRRVTAA